MEQRILVVDDDLFIREIYEDVLKTAGFEVDSAVNGEEALEKLKSGGYALILLDMMMPKVDGLGVLYSLSQTPSVSKNGPIILLTNSDLDARVKEGLTKGASSYLIKAALTPDQLLEKIKDFLK